jgi:hypothetical protein
MLVLMALRCDERVTFGQVTIPTITTHLLTPTMAYVAVESDEVRSFTYLKLNRI